jgi:putative flippase GtrA
MNHIPPRQFFRYILVGIWNTAFGYSIFALFTYVLSRRWPHYGYIPSSILSSMVGITVSFFGYKRFVFKTKGNYLREWLRCLAVYGSGITFNWVTLPCVVFLIRRTTTIDKYAPYIAAGLVMGFTTLYTFVGHVKFSFRTTEPAGVRNLLETPIEVHEP